MEVTIGICVFLFLIFVGLCAYHIIHGNDTYWSRLGVPTVLVGDLVSFWDRLILRHHGFEIDNRIYQEAKRNKYKFVGTMESRNPVLYLTELELIRTIAIKDFSQFRNHRSKGKVQSKEFSASGLITTRDQQWKDLRSVITPALSTLKLKEMFGLMVESGDGLINFITKSHKNHGMNISELIRRYVTNTTCSVSFGINSQSYEEETKLGKFDQLILQVEKDFLKLSALKVYLNRLFGGKTVHSRKFTESGKRIFKETVQATLNYRRSNKIKRNDFLNALMEAQEEAEKENSKLKYIFTDDFFFSQCFGFFLAGYWSSAFTLMFTLYELAKNPTIQDQLRSEIFEMFKKEGKLSYDCVKDLKYLDQVITESQRLYVVSGAQIPIERECSESYHIPGTNIILPKGTVINIPMHSIHSDPEIYPEPQKFLPSRWTQEFKSKLHPSAYIPFGIGPRICVANRYATILHKVCISQLILNFKFSPTKSTPVPLIFEKFQLELIMRPTKDLYLDIIPISSQK